MRWIDDAAVGAVPVLTGLYASHFLFVPNVSPLSVLRGFYCFLEDLFDILFMYHAIAFPLLFLYFLWLVIDIDRDEYTVGDKQDFL